MELPDGSLDTSPPPKTPLVRDSSHAMLDFRVDNPAQFFLKFFANLFCIFWRHC